MSIVIAISPNVLACAIMAADEDVIILCLASCELSYAKFTSDILLYAVITFDFVIYSKSLVNFNLEDVAAV